MKTHPHFARSFFRRAILTTAMLPAALVTPASAADVTWSGGPQTINVQPVYGEGLREGFLGKFDAPNIDNETTPNPNRIGGSPVPPISDVGTPTNPAPLPDPLPPYNFTLDVRMGQINQNADPNARPDGFSEAGGLPYGWSNSRTFIYTGEIQVTSAFLAFVMNNDDTDWLKINGVVVLDDNAWDTPVQARSGGAGDNLNSGPPSGDPNLVAGLGLTLNNWYDIEFRISDSGGGGEGPSGQGAGLNWTTTYGVGMNTTGLQANGTTPLGTSVNGADYVKPAEPAGGGPTLFRYLISAGAGGDDVHVTGNTVTTITGETNSVTAKMVTENSLRFEPAAAGGTVNLTINNPADGVQRTFIANSTILANSNNVVANIDGSATVRLNNLDDNGQTGVVLNKNGGTGDLVISGSAAAGGLDGVTLKVTDGRMVIEGATDPIVGVAPIQINGPNAKLRIRTKIGTGITALESGTLEHFDRTNDLVGGNLNITPGKTLLTEIADGVLEIAGNLAGGILNKIGVGRLGVNGTTTLSAVTVNGGRLELNGQTTLAAAPTLVSGTLALLNLGTGVQANSIPGPINIPTGTILEGSPSAFVDSTGAADILNLTGGTLRFVGPSTGLNLFVYDSDPNATGAYAALTDFAAMQAHYAALVPSLRTITSNNGNTLISYNPSGDGGVPFAIHGSTDADTIEALFTGKFIAPTAGDYVFDPISDDGSQVYIDGVLVANNNFPQGIGPSRPGTATLTPGAHDIAITFNEGIGGAGMFVNVTSPGGTPRLLANSDLVTTTATTPAPNVVNVQTNSTIDITGNLGMAVNSVLIQPSRTLTVTGSRMTANTVTLNGAGAYTFDGAGTIVATILDDNSDGTVAGGPFDVDIVKTGTGVLVLDNTTTPQLQNAGSSITVTGGSVGLLLGGARQPLGNASINFNGGGVVLSSKGGNQNFAIPTFNGNGSLEARQLGTGVAGPVTITLTGNLNVAAGQTVALGTADNYKMVVGGSATGSGTLVVKSGELETSTGTALQNLNLVVGQTAPTTVRLNAAAPNLLSLGGSSGGTLVVGTGTAPVTLTIGGGANARFNGAITQNNNQVVSVVKNGTNTQTLGGVNAFTGGVTVNDGTLEVRAGSIGTNTITLAGGTLQFIGTGLLGQFYAGDDGGANVNFNTFASYTSYFAGRTPPTVVASTDVPAHPTLSYDPTGGDTQMFANYGYTNNNNIVSRMSGRINIPADGNYTFSTRSDDGSMLFIDGQTVVANNFYQGMTTRSGSVVLTAGVHDIDIGFYEGGGGNGLVVTWAGPGFGAADLPNTVLENTGAYSNQDNPINMTSNSRIDARGGTLSLGPITLAAGTTLTTTAGSVGFTRTTLPAAGTYTFNVAGDLIAGTVVDGAAVVNITKTGAGNLVLNSATAELTNANSVININEGAVTAVLSATANPLGNATLNLNGGALRLSSSGGDVSFARPVQLNQNSTLEAGNFGGGAVDGVTASVTNAVTVANGRILTLRSRNDYTLRLGAVGGGGNVTVDGGIVSFSGATNPNTLTVTSGLASVTTGTLAPAAGATVSPAGTLGFNPGANNTTAYSGPLTVNGGTLRAQSGTADLTGASIAFSTTPTAVPNALRGRFLGGGGEFVPSLYRPDTEAGIADAKSLSAVEATLSGPLSFQPYQAADPAFQTFFGGVNAAQRFTAAFFGTFTAPATGDYQAQVASIDDFGGFWIDRNQNGIFEQAGSAGSELLSSRNCCGDGPIGTVPLVAGQKYQVAIGVEDTGGGSSLIGRLGLPTGGMFVVNPGDPAQAGLWSYDAVGGNILVDPDAQLRASSITGASDVHLAGNGARLSLDSVAATTSTIGVLRNSGGIGESATVNLGANSSLLAGRLEVAPDTTFVKSGAGTLTATAQTLAAGSTLQIDAGTVVLNGPNTTPANTGAVQVNSGLLRVIGAISGAVTVAGPGTLEGTGQVGPATVAGRLSPGVAGVGTINTADLTLDAGTLALEVQNVTAYDNANVVGTLSLLNNPLLRVTRLGGGPLQNNDLFFILINDGADAVVGQFGGIPNQGQGRPTLADVDGQRFLVSYFGDLATNTFDVPGGNDVVLQAVPEPQTWATVMSGIGALVGLQRFRRRRK